jgi:hypothetical protein
MDLIRLKYFLKNTSLVRMRDLLVNASSMCVFVYIRCMCLFMYLLICGTLTIKVSTARRS